MAHYSGAGTCPVFDPFDLLEIYVHANRQPTHLGRPPRSATLSAVPAHALPADCGRAHFQYALMVARVSLSNNLLSYLSHPQLHRLHNCFHEV